MSLLHNAPERLAREVAEQAAALLQARLRALPQAPRAARRQVQRVQERPAALRRCAPSWGSRLASEPSHASDKTLDQLPFGQPHRGLSGWPSAEAAMPGAA